MSQDMAEILNAVDGKQYHVACTRVFEITHDGQGLGDGDSVTHPNRYAARSRELEQENELREKEQVKSESTNDQPTPMVVDG